MMLDQEEWRCPTCIDLCFKPAVNSGCGHVFCFWCIHKAMSPYTSSACPVCRAKTGHLPAICAKLHRFLSCQFPEAYAQRREETEADERAVGAASPDPEVSDTLPPPAAPGQWGVQHFLCDNPSCSQLLCQPLVLNCGHTVCQPTCLEVTGSGGTGAPSTSSSPAPAAAAAAAAAALPGGNPSNAIGSAGKGSNAGMGAAYECPACGMAGRQPPKVCKQLGDLIAELFPEESRQRQAECQLAQQARQQAQQQQAQQQQAQQQAQQQLDVAAAGAAAAAAAGLASAEVSAGEEGESEPVTPRASANASEGTGEQVEQQEAAALDQQQEQQEQQGEEQAGEEVQEERTLSPSLTAALRRRAAAGGPEQAMAQRMEASLQRMAAGQDYTWHGVGCDSCGLYPIQGKRFQCQDCPDAMGYDLCGACMARGVPDIVGRFNQRHRPEHRMHQVRPRITAMHMLQAANPELSMEHLMYLLELTMQGDEEDEAQQGQQQAQQGQQAQQQGQQQAPQQGQEGQQQGQQQQPVEVAGDDGGSAGSDSGEASGEGAAPGGAGAGAGQGEHGESEMLPVLRRGPRPVFDAAAEEPSPSAYVPQQQQHAPPPLQQQRASGGEAEGLIEEEEVEQQQQQRAVGGEAAEALVQEEEEEESMMGGQQEEEEAGVTAVHVPVEQLLGDHGGPPAPA